MNDTETIASIDAKMMVSVEAWTIPDDIVPGVFFARLVMEDPPPHWRTDASEIQPSRKFANRCWDNMRMRCQCSCHLGQSVF